MTRNTKSDVIIEDLLSSIGSPAAEPRDIIIATSNIHSCLIPFFPVSLKKSNTAKNMTEDLNIISNAMEKLN